MTRGSDRDCSTRSRCMRTGTLLSSSREKAWRLRGRGEELDFESVGVVETYAYYLVGLPGERKPSFVVFGSTHGLRLLYSHLIYERLLI